MKFSGLILVEHMENDATRRILVSLDLKDALIKEHK